MISYDRDWENDEVVDFCSKDAVGYGFQQCVIYCKDHIDEALKIEDNFLEEISKCQEELND